MKSLGAVLVRGGMVVIALCATAGCTYSIDTNIRSEPRWTEILPERSILPPNTRNRVKPSSCIAVMDIQDNSGAFSPRDLLNATEILRGRLSSSGRFAVVDKSRQEAKLRTLVKQSKRDSYLACVDEACQIPLGKALAADIVLRSTISCLGDGCQFAVELIDLAMEAAVGGGSADFDKSPSGLSAAMRSVVRQILD